MGWVVLIGDGLSLFPLVVLSLPVPGTAGNYEVVDCLLLSYYQESYLMFAVGLTPFNQWPFVSQSPLTFHKSVSIST